MENTPNPTKLAILIDAENVVASHADLIFAQAEAMGEIAAKEIYGTAAALTAWVAPVLKYAIHPNLTIRASKGKNSSDIALVIGAMDLLQAGMETIVIASSDSDFSALSVRLRNAGVNVVGMGTEKSNALWRTACSSFIVLDHPAPAPKPQSAPPAEAAAPAAAESAPEPARKPASARRQARPATTTHKERMSIIQQFIEKRLDQSGGRLQVDPLFSGLNKLPEYKTDRQGSGRKPLNYLSSTFAEIFQFVRSADGKTWVSRVGTDPLPAGVEPAGEGVAEESEVAEAEEAAVEVEEIAEKNVIVPSDFSQAYEDYARIQDKQGLPLRKYAGRNAQLYVYEVKNYSPESRKMLAELLVCSDTAIASMVYSDDGGSVRLAVG